MTRLQAVVALGLAFGLVGGALNDPLPAPRDVRRGRYHVLAFDFHVHTRFGDGFLSPLDVLRHAERRGLDGIAITEHNMVAPAKLARAWSQATGGPLVVVGEEITTGGWHVIGLGLEQSISARQRIEGAVDAIHAQNGVAIAAHPVEHFWPELEPARETIDGSEVMHPLAYNPRRATGWSWDGSRAYFARGRERRASFVAIGSSDYHAFAPLGLVRTLVFAERRDAASVLDALRVGRTVVHDVDARAYGDPEALALLANDPYPATPPPPGYASRGLFDVLSRAMAWCALMALVLARGERATRASSRAS